MAARLSKNGKPLGRPPKQSAAADAAHMHALGLTPNDVAMLRSYQRHQAKYDAAGNGRRMAAWQPPSSGPNLATAGLQKIRNRSHDAVRNDWAGESGVQKWSTALIGIGITPRFKRIGSATRRRAITDLFTDFVKQADADCVNNLYGMQTLVVRSWIEAGEVFARRRYRRASDGLAVPVQIQLLEADMCPLLDADTYAGLPAGNRIRSGIELDRRGRRVAYWFYKEHPGDGAMVNIGADALVRVPAEDVCHVFEQKRPGQLRGVTPLASVLMRLRNIDDYEDNTLERQKLANLWVGFISRQLPAADPTDPNSGFGGALDDGDMDPLLPLKPGLIQELADGQTFNFANPPEAGTNYSDYLRTSHLGTSAAMGLPYELFSGDIKDISDRTLRVVVNDFRRFAEQRQWQIVIPMFCERVVQWFAEAALMIGEISATEFPLVLRAEHAPHGWAYIHPVQDVQGKAMEVSNGFRSRSSVIGERGDDPNEVDQERADDIAREDELGLPVMGVIEQPAKDDQGDEDGIDNEEYSAPPNPSATKQTKADWRDLF